MLIVVRHGATSFNDNASGERIRGWLPIPLTLKGMKEAHETAEALSQVEGVKHLYCSDMVRTLLCSRDRASCAHDISGCGVADGKRPVR